MYFSLKSAVVMTWKALCSSSHDRCAQLLLELCEAAKNKWNLQILGWIQLLGICAATEEDGDWWQGSSPWSARAGASRGSFASCRAKGWVWTSQAMSSWCVCLCTSLLVIILGRAEITPQLWEQPCSHVKGSRTWARRSTPSLRAALVFVRKKKKAAVLLLLLLKPLSLMPRTACVEFQSTLSTQAFLGEEGAAPLQPCRWVEAQGGPFCSSKVLLHRAQGWFSPAFLLRFPFLFSHPPWKSTFFFFSFIFNLFFSHVKYFR